MHVLKDINVLKEIKVLMIRNVPRKIHFFRKKNAWLFVWAEWSTHTQVDVRVISDHPVSS